MAICAYGRELESPMQLTRLLISLGMLLCCSTNVSAAERKTAIMPEDLNGRWAPDFATVDWAVTVSGWKDLSEKDRATEKEKLAKQWQDAHMAFTPRMTRLVYGSDDMLVGLWRLEDAKPTTAALIVMARGVDHRFALTYDGTHLRLDGQPWGTLAFAKAKAEAETETTDKSDKKPAGNKKPAAK